MAPLAFAAEGSRIVVVDEKTLQLLVVAGFDAVFSVNGVAVLVEDVGRGHRVLEASSCAVYSTPRI